MGKDTTGDELVPSLYAKDCYDSSRQKDKKQAPMFCPFNKQSGEFAWIDERNQNSEGKYELTFIIMTISFTLRSKQKHVEG